MIDRRHPGATTAIDTGAAGDGSMRRLELAMAFLTLAIGLCLAVVR